MFNRRRRAALILTVAAATLSLVAACGSGTKSGSAHSTGPAPGSPATTSSAAQFPVTLKAANGSVTIAAKPTSIVSLSPTATETLFAIGAGSQVKAVDKDSDYPPNAPNPEIDAYHLNVEALAKYKPDLVVAADVTAAQAKQLRALGITVLSEPAATSLGQAYAEIAQLGQATGHADTANTLVADMKQRIAQIVASAPKSHATYYWELDQTYYSETSSTFIGQLVGLLGLRSIADSAKGAAAAGGYPQLSAEFILKANPAYIFLADTKCCRQSAASVAARPGWSTLTAVKVGRVVELDDDIASRWGPRIVDLLQTVAQALQRHPTS